MPLKSITPRLNTLGSRLRKAPKAVDPFYLTAEWKALAKYIKQLRGYVCEMCGKDFSKRQHKLIADHIVERKDGGADLDPGNIQCLCTWCHNRKTAQARRMRFQIIDL
ncbi:HNH endonuclease signature motif containing protein [Pseudovibrio sp. Ad26]|uniref:HNH endonuclease n=1 Tax=Pseudovibrio sp. Ad26 TaxID=989410 RepID=UPI0007B291FF|nr:HNH endonuclease signature motif containing protein [Pseudovibrio sp. Ad26]KZL06383.1 HNH endonuclease [Pseudovibrio sp. Ad26]